MSNSLRSHGLQPPRLLHPWGFPGKSTGVGCHWTWLRDFTFTFHCHALEKEIATHSCVLAWRIPGTGEPGGLPSLGSQRVRHDWSDAAAASASQVCRAWKGHFYCSWGRERPAGTIGCLTWWPLTKGQTFMMSPKPMTNSSKGGSWQQLKHSRGKDWQIQNAKGSSGMWKKPPCLS